MLNHDLLYICKRNRYSGLPINEVNTSVLGKWCFKQFCEIHRKLSVPESPSNRAASLPLVILFKEVLWHGCFHVNITKFLVTPFPQNPFGKLLLKKLLRLLTMKSIIFPHSKLKFCF